MKWLSRLFLFLFSCSVALALDGDGISSPSGQMLYQQHCAACHNGAETRAPAKLALSFMMPEKIYQALSDGRMRDMARGLSDGERRQLAEYLSGRKLGQQVSKRSKVECKNDKQWFDYKRSPLASGWGMTNTRNTRFIPKDVAKISLADVSRLKLKWAFSFPQAVSARSQPAVAGGAVFVGGEDGTLYALDAKSGCLHWTFQSSSQIRTAITISDWDVNDNRAVPTLYFGDASLHTYAVNATTGALIWKTKIDTHPFATLTGSAVLHKHKDKKGTRLYVPVASWESSFSKDPNNACCTHRGSISALDADTGEVIWKTYVIPEKPTEHYKNARGVAQFGASGAGIWSSPTLDEARNRMYISTGENNTPPAINGGAVIALDLDNGHILWSYQDYPGDVFNAACFENVLGHYGVNCPKEYRARISGDGGASPILVRDQGGTDVIIMGQKSGDIYGFDPEAQRIVWRRAISRGDYNYGVVWGMAAEGHTVFANVHNQLHTDFMAGPYWGEEELGIYAMNAFTGKPVWRALVSDHCAVERCQGYAAAMTVIPDVLFAGAQDGYFRAFNTRTGKLLWEVNTAQPFKTLSGDSANGGSINGPGAVVADGMVYVNSGYALGAPGVTLPGNVFLAFSIDGK